MSCRSRAGLSGPPRRPERPARRTYPTSVLLLACALSACQAGAQPVITPHPTPVPQLQRDLDTILAAPALARGYWGVLVRSLSRDDTLYAVGARKLLIPASALKVVTLAVAAERLGWQFTYDTPLVADGSLEGGTLHGNLLIVGSGDPSANQGTIDSWADQLKAIGLTSVTGGVVADGTAFDSAGLGFGWSWDDLPYYYAAPISAAQFHENAVDVTIMPGQTPGDLSSVSMAPAGSGLVIDNAIGTGPRDGPIEFAARRFPGSDVVALRGSVSAGSPPTVRSLAVNDPARFLAGALSEALLARGIALGRPASSMRSGASDRAAATTRLIWHHSPPLGVIARRMMEVSQNQYAETLLATMGAQTGNGTGAGGLKVVESVLAAWGVSADAVILRDGSGLSRYDYVSPEALVQVLTHMYRDPRHRDPYFQSFNVAGESGTLAARMKNTAAFRNVRAKDGAMSGVRTLCGIVTSAEGERLVFALLANNYDIPGPTVTATIDAVVARLATFKRH